MSLPSLATVEDVKAVVGILYGKMSGDTLKNAKASTTKPSIFAEQRIEAYKAWELLTVDGDRLKLTSQGRKLHDATEQQQYEIFAKVVGKFELYLITLRYLHSGSYEQRIVAEIGSHWADNFADQVATNSDRLLSEQVTAFMSVVAGAGLGRYVRGRKGNPTRLEVDREALENFVTGMAQAATKVEPESVQDSDQEKEPAGAPDPPDSTPNMSQVNPILSP